MFTIPELKKLDGSSWNLGAVVYHIVKKSDKYNLDEGYIGVTGNFEQRKKQHIDGLSVGEHTNYKLQEYYDEFKDVLEVYAYKTFLGGTIKDAYLLEEYLRPRPNIGLNIAVGGKREFDERFNTKKYSVTATQQTPAVNIFTAVKNIFKSADKSLATFAENSLKKSELTQTNNKKELEEWAKQQQLKSDRKIAAHIARRKQNPLSKEDAANIEAWKKRIT
jgi:hypothetical protein